jgi:biopolymer transport protein ExbD
MGMGVNLGDLGGDEGEAQESVVAEINITPLTDVFLVLLIIFMVTANALAEAESQSRTGVRVALPKANAASAVAKKRMDPVVTVTKTGQIFIFNKPVTLENVEAEIKRALEEAASETLLLRTDTSTQMGAAVQVMSSGRKAGAKSIMVLTESGEKK